MGGPLLESERLRGRVEQRLNAIEDPCALAQGVSIGLADMGMLVGVQVDPLPAGGHQVSVDLRTTTPGCLSVPFFDDAVRRALQGIEGVTSCAIEWSSPEGWSPESMAATARQQLDEQRRLRSERRARPVARTLEG